MLPLFTQNHFVFFKKTNRKLTGHPVRQGSSRNDLGTLGEFIFFSRFEGEFPLTTAFTQLQPRKKQEWHVAKRLPQTGTPREINILKKLQKLEIFTLTNRKHLVKEYGNCRNPRPQQGANNLMCCSIILNWFTG